MHSWRLSATHSAQRQATCAVNRRRTIRGRRWALMRLSSWVTGAWWGTALTCALLFCAPLAFFFGHIVPDWMPDVFVVAGVPVTLVVSILVFLLANVAGQELRTASSFRAVITRTFLVWPIALAAVFLAWCAAIEIFGSVNGTPPPGFATAWAIVTTVAPDSVAATVRSAFAEEVRRVVRDRERGRVALQLLEDACGGAGVARRYYGPGAAPVGFPRAGSITDIDLRLPARLADLSDLASVSVGLRLGFDARPDAAVVWIDASYTTEAARAVADGVSISPRLRGRHTVEQLFDEVLDLARRAVAGGGSGPIDSTFDLIADCLAELPAAYQLYGLDFTEEQVRNSSILGDDYTLTRPLSRFAADVTASGNEHAKSALPTLGLKFSRYARELGAPLLLQYAVDLWLQLLSAVRIQNPALHRRYLAELGPFAGMVIRYITADAANELRPLAQREQDASLLPRLFGFQAELLKAAIDADDTELEIQISDLIEQYDLIDVILANALGGGSVDFPTLRRQETYLGTNSSNRIKRISGLLDAGIETAADSKLKPLIKRVGREQRAVMTKLRDLKETVTTGEQKQAVEAFQSAWHRANETPRLALERVEDLLNEYPIS
jgi:hypothetical protein